MAGVHDPHVIDLVTHDPATGEYALIMVQESRWTDSPEQLAQLGEKINNYAQFIIDEGMLRSYPQSAGHPLRVQLDCTGVPTPPEAQKLIDLATETLLAYRIRLVVNRLA